MPAAQGRTGSHAASRSLPCRVPRTRPPQPPGRPPGVHRGRRRDHLRSGRSRRGARPRHAAPHEPCQRGDAEPDRCPEPAVGRGHRRARPAADGRHRDLHDGGADRRGRAAAANAGQPHRLRVAVRGGPGRSTHRARRRRAADRQPGQQRLHAGDGRGDLPPGLQRPVPAARSLHEDHELQITASFSISAVDASEPDPLGHADSQSDRAMYAAKQADRNPVRPTWDHD